MNDPLTEMFRARSREVFRSGQRTDAHFAPKVQKYLRRKFGVDGPCLISTYVGGDVITVTTADDCHFMTIEDLPENLRRRLRKEHEGNATSGLQRFG